VPYSTATSNALLTDMGSAESPHTLTLFSRREALDLAERWAQTCTAPYRAPELFDPRSGATLTPASDIWSVGCCLYYVAYGRDCFDGTLTCALSKLPLPHGDGLDAVIRQCLRIEPTERPTLLALIRQLDTLPTLELRVGEANGSLPLP
jgi:serine/threonine kinase 16